VYAGVAVAAGGGCMRTNGGRQRRPGLTPSPVIPDPETAGKLADKTGGKTAGEVEEGDAEKGGASGKVEAGSEDVSTDMRVEEAFQREKVAAEKEAEAPGFEAPQAEQEAGDTTLSSRDPLPSSPRGFLTGLKRNPFRRGGIRCGPGSRGSCPRRPVFARA